MKLLKEGDSEESVIKLQTILRQKGYTIGALDGIFGLKTKLAVLAFQKENKLDADGMVGDNTWTALLKNLQPVPSVILPQSPKSANYYPPKPNFESPSRAKVISMFSEFQWQTQGSSEIRILGDWVQRNIVKIEIPVLAGKIGASATGTVMIHRLCVESLKAIFDEINTLGLNNRITSYAGAFYPRRIRGSQAISNHSWGSAIDLNAPENWLGKQPAKIGQKGCLLELVPIFNKYGWFWGGHYEGRLDGMHFECAKLI